MKNNRKNRKRVKLYFKWLNKRYNLSGNLLITPIYLYSKKKKSFNILIGSKNNSRSELMKSIPKIKIYG